MRQYSSYCDTHNKALTLSCLSLEQNKLFVRSFEANKLLKVEKNIHPEVTVL